MPSEGTPRKDPVVPEVGGSVEAPPHPPMTRWERVVVDFLIPGGIAVVAICIPAAALVVLGKWLGGAVIASVVALLVVVAGVVLARRRISPAYEREMVREADKRGETISPAEARARARRFRLHVGTALAVAGGIGLAIAFAALD